ncbi:efflux RND transporter permease subunit [Romboutsia sp. Marseille-P6047]|uniref:efflux RND transporter permease subunit n=1 Tax=Romboutsia sp. Marseille-P6047 TaxID=2161817 RepID=UPI000F044FCE|nr:MMPL family transporter [Romboutsia sp. Marseille-P6047]
MYRLAKQIASHRKLIIFIALILLIPSLFGYIKTNINYDILSYLPDSSSTIKAEKILKEDFGSGSLSMLIVEGMEDKDVAKLKEKVSKVDGVNSVLWIDDFMDLSVPKEIIPKDMVNFLYNGDKSTMMVINFEDGSASTKTMNAIDDIRRIAGKQTFLSGMAGIVKDTKDISEQEMPMYVILAGIVTTIILCFALESYITPFIFIGSIALAIIYNFGTNIIFGEISYITKALTAILQLGVTMDYSIFLLHRYDEELELTDDRIDAMSKAIVNTAKSVFGSSITTVAGFLALCAMDLTLGKDIGLVMAKGVIIGVICTITILPAFILTFDKLIHKYKHKSLLPTFEKTSNFIVKNYKKLAILLVIVFIPAFIGNQKAEVYYNLDESLPDNLDSIVATNKLRTDYNMNSTDIILIDKSMSSYEKSNMVKEIEDLDGVNLVLALEKYLGPGVYEDILPSEILDQLISNGYEEIIVNSEYKAASPECSEQLKEMNKIVHKYDKNALIGGEAPLTEDLIQIADTDFKKVSAVSIIAIFLIIAIIFKSISLPVILVLAIETAIFANLGIPYYTGTVEPFIASIVLGTIQLGATVDYAILLTSRFQEELINGYDKFTAMKNSIQSCGRSIVTSALSFFGATIGVGVISKLELIGSLCALMARGAIISMFVIIFFLPAILIIFEKIILKTSKGFLEDKKKQELSTVQD